MGNKVIKSATLEHISLMPDGTYRPCLTNIVYGEPDEDGDVYAEGCFDKAIKQSDGKYKLHNHKPHGK